MSWLARVHARLAGPRRSAVHHHERRDPPGADQLTAFNGQTESHGTTFLGIGDDDRASQVERLRDGGCVVDQRPANP